MAYTDSRGRRPFEKASKAAHSAIINNPIVQNFLGFCDLPAPPKRDDVVSLSHELPRDTGDISAVIAIDGGYTETYVREEYPSASVAFLTFGPLFFNLQDLAALDRQPFLAPEDMAKLKNLERYSLVLPTKLVRAVGGKTFAEGVRATIHNFLCSGDGHLARALQWLLFQEWKANCDREPWIIPHCPNPECEKIDIEFTYGESLEKKCSCCGKLIYLADGLRLYERIDEELGSGGIIAYLLATLEQLVLVHLIRSVLSMKPSLLREVLFLRDGPLAFFGNTAPLRKPMRELMKYLSLQDRGKPIINLIGVEKSGAFVDHAALIEDDIPPGNVLVLNNDYIYRYVIPGDPSAQSYGFNTYYGSKIIYRGVSKDIYVGTIPTSGFVANPTLNDLMNGSRILNVLGQLHCSMYDNALVPVALANKLVSLADMPSSEILKKFARDRIRSGAP